MTNAPLARPPESFRPDRPEVINEAGKQPLFELAPGVLLDCLVGKHNAARNLTTGLVTFAPNAQLPCHTHPVSESTTVLSGTALIGVEGREYFLGPLDNIVSPRGLAHAARNGSSSEPARLHVALASESLVSELVSMAFGPRSMPEASAGVHGKERITRFKTAPRSEAGPGTSSSITLTRTSCRE